MDDMQSKLNAVLSNPQMMQQIMSMAQSLGAQQASKQEPPKQEPPPPKREAQPTLEATPQIDLSALQKVASLAGQSNLSREQRSLLSALSPYLSREHIARLEKAMRAAALARVASSVLGTGGLSLPSGR